MSNHVLQRWHRIVSVHQEHGPRSLRSGKHRTPLFRRIDKTALVLVPFLHFGKVDVESGPLLYRKQASMLASVRHLAQKGQYFVSAVGLYLFNEALLFIQVA